MSDQGLTAADRLRGLAVQPEVENLPFICGRDDIEDAADAVEACEGVPEEDLRYLASQGGLVNLLETLRRYLAVAEADGISDDPTEEDDASIGVRGDGKPLCMTYWHIRQLNALLPPVRESETQDERFQERPPERLRELTEEAQEAAIEIIAQTREGAGKSNVSGLPDIEAALYGYPNPGTESDADRVLSDIATERRRQVVVEGWTPEHDDAHSKGELIRAARAYATSAASDTAQEVAKRLAVQGMAPVGWPWSPDWFKPKNPRRDLVRAAALIVAEIERIDRAGEDPEPMPPSRCRLTISGELRETAEKLGEEG